MDCRGAMSGMVLVAVALVSCDKSTAPKTMPPPPPPAGTPDPTLLPAASTTQAPLTAAYDALNVLVEVPTR